MRGVVCFELVRLNVTSEVFQELVKLFFTFIERYHDRFWASCRFNLTTLQNVLDLFERKRDVWCIFSSWNFFRRFLDFLGVGRGRLPYLNFLGEGSSNSCSSLSSVSLSEVLSVKRGSSEDEEYSSLLSSSLSLSSGTGVGLVGGFAFEGVASGFLVASLASFLASNAALSVSLLVSTRTEDRIPADRSVCGVAEGVLGVAVGLGAVDFGAGDLEAVVLRPPAGT